MKIDRMLFDRFADTVRTDGVVKKAVESGNWELVLDYVNREVFDKPEDYYTLDKLRKAAAVDRRLTLREILERVFDLIPAFKSRDELLEEEFNKFVADHKPQDSDSIQAIKTYFKAYATRRTSLPGHNRQSVSFARSCHQSRVLHRTTIRAVPLQIPQCLVPEYIKDYVSLNQFAA